MLENYNKYNRFLTAYYNDLRKINKEKYENKLVELSKLRGFSLETIDKQGIVYTGEFIDMLLPKYAEDLDALGLIHNNKPIFNNRWIIPIYDLLGNIVSLVGYSNKSDQRYIYSTSRFYNRSNTLYNLQNIDRAYEKGYSILVEGITDAISLINQGYDNVFANCGTHNSKITQGLLDTIGGVVVIPDRDMAGQRAYKSWKFNRKIKINVPIRYKDVDEYIRKESDISELHTTILQAGDDLKRLSEGMEKEITMIV